MRIYVRTIKGDIYAVVTTPNVKIGKLKAMLQDLTGKHVESYLIHKRDSKELIPSGHPPFWLVDYHPMLKIAMMPSKFCTCVALKLDVE